MLKEGPASNRGIGIIASLLGNLKHSGGRWSWMSLFTSEPNLEKVA